MDVRLLGKFTVLDEQGVVVSLGGEKQRSVLAMLALRPNSYVTIDALAEGVWGTDVPARYPQNIQVYVSTLRRLLDPLRTRQMPSRIIGRAGGYELLLGPEETDVARFRSLHAQGVSALADSQPATAAVHARAALAEWRGDPCADLAFAPFASRMSSQLVEERWSAFELCMDAELASGRAHELIPELEDALTTQPFRERLWEQLMVALYRVGRQRDALAAFGRARDALVDTIGVEPGEELRALELQVLTQDRSLDAPRASAMRSARLPVPLTSLIGRADLVAEVSRSLLDGRLVTLTGPGGVGKTRVAIAAAQAAGPTLDLTPTFVDLSAERDPARVAALIANALGDGQTNTAEQVVARFVDAPPFLLLDNFEQLVTAVDVVQKILEGIPNARALVTSRIRLGLAGEQVIEVPPLHVEPLDDGLSTAMQLFAERGRQADPRFDPQRHRAAIVAICRGLEGVPLAIELAASRLAVLEPEEVFDGIAAALDVEVRRGPERHRSLRAAIEWSLDLLDPSEISLFAALS
ncbi:MAG: AfsR/SARP family transcriptional regulator, partial [Ilumatobacteraceae bacterium]